MKTIFLACSILSGVLLMACSGGDSSSPAAPSSTSQPEASSTPAPTQTLVSTIEPTEVPTEVPPPILTATSAPVINQPVLPPVPTSQPPLPPPPPPPPTQIPQPQLPAGPVTFTITASLLQFNTRQLLARSGAAVTVNFTNQDTGVAHDISFSIAGLGHGNTCFGPCSDRYTFTAPAPGQYSFFCTLHIEMQGTLIVTP